MYVWVLCLSYPVMALEVEMYERALEKKMFTNVK